MTVLIPSWRRAAQLERCLLSLSKQTVYPDQVVVIWQGDDTDTAALAHRIGAEVPFNLVVAHSADKGVVAAENVGLSMATSEIIALLDDDAIAPETWISKYQQHYLDPSVGAVGGPMMNYTPEGKPFPRRSAETIGIIRRTGKVIGNMYDLDERLLAQPPRDVHHLVGANMTIRRSAFHQFEPELLAYWQMFETDACLAVASRGYRVIFDPGNPIHHVPTNTAFVGDRTGDLHVKIFNPAFNHALILAKYRPFHVSLLQLAFAALTGSVGSPGLLALPLAAIRHGNPLRETKILIQTNLARHAGWRRGRTLRRRSQKSIRHEDAECRTPQGATAPR